MNKKAALQMSFAWLFAIIVGGFILFLTIYGVTKVKDTGSETKSAVTAKEIQTLLNPLETGYESGVTASISTAGETRIYNKCEEPDFDDAFGNQIIQIAQKTFDEWTDPGIENKFSNKYLFSEKIIEGKKFLLFSKPLDFPFKVADVIYITSAEEKYCFTENVPDHIIDELEELNQENLLVDSALCGSSDTFVCFSNGPDCDIEVNYNLGRVEKNGRRLIFETDALMYAAIFAEKDIYECQVERLMNKFNILLSLYLKKGEFAACSSTIGSSLSSLQGDMNLYSSSIDLYLIKQKVDDLETENKLSTCRRW
jgi:hypothetical protein